MTTGLEEKKLRIFAELLDQRSVGSMLNTAAEVLGNPIFVADRGLNIIAQSGKDSVPATNWPEDFGWRESAVLDDARYAGDFKRVYSADEPVLGVYPSLANRMLAARIRDGQAIMGHAVVLECYKGFSDEDFALIVIICQALAILLSSRGNPLIQTERYQSLFSDLLEGSISDEDIRFRLDHARIVLPKSMQLLVARPLHEGFRISAYYLREQLLHGFPDSLGIIQGEEIVHLVKAADDAHTMENSIRSSVFLEGIAIGISRRFKNPCEMKAHYTQADQALELSNLQEEGGIFFYEDVMVRHIAELATRVCDPAVFHDPGLERLKRYDAEHGTAHVSDLETYLNCGRNVTRAAELLMVHRNSMRYRVKQVERIAGVDLSDERICFLLQLTLNMRV